MPLMEIPAHVWPQMGALGDTSEAPVFASSFFRFADDTGFGLCVCIHHNVVDGFGFAELLRLWAACCTDIPETPTSDRSASRLDWFSHFLANDIQALVNYPLESIFECHPEYSPLPPTLPAEFPPCTSKLLQIPVAYLNALSETLLK